jgi:hypothetical protein
MSLNHGLVTNAEIAEAEWLAGWISITFLEDPCSSKISFSKNMGTFLLGQFQKQELLTGLQNHLKILIRKKVKIGIENQQIIISLFMDN